MPVYLDYNATTPLDEEVLEAMLPYLGGGFGNPSSAHSFGRIAKEAIENARSQIAGALGCSSSQVVFTSCGSEANNLFLKGLASYLKPAQVAFSAIEHPSISKSAESLARSGWTTRKIRVDGKGLVDMGDAEAAISVPTGMLSVMLANNETGVVQDVGTLSEMARRKKIWMHTDAVQAFGKIPFDFPSLGVHAMTISSHKIYGPKGAGALVLDKRLTLNPLIDGGGQESGLRSGTENVAAIVGFGVAATLAKTRQEHAASSMAKMKLKLEEALRGMGAAFFSDADRALPNTVYFSFSGIEGGTLVGEMDKMGFAIASGSACSSGKTEPSATLLAMGVSPDLARGAVRVSLGWENTDAHIAAFLEAMRMTLDRLSSMASRLQV